jgi:hypothetical protein
VSEAAVKFTPEPGATQVRPDEQVVVAADKGRLTSVTVRSAAGKELAGELDSGGEVWRSNGILAVDTAYTVTAVASRTDGASKTQTATFTTLKPSSTMGAIMIPDDNWTVGVGMDRCPVHPEREEQDAILKTLTRRQLRT